MKTPAIPLLLSALALSGMAVADVPKKVPSSRYIKLWTDSPFTTKPVIDPGNGPENPLVDYGLIGVSPIGGDNYRATIMNKKKPDEPRIYLETGREVGGFTLLKVIHKNGDPLATTLQVKTGSSTGTVSVDEKLITLAAPPAAKVAPPAAGGVPGQNPPPGPNNVQPGGGRQPRPRVVPPPVPTTGQQVPQPTQQVQGAAPAPQAQGGNRQNTPRATRRPN